ncbi:MAG: Sec-independent protein translocase protein TatB [Hyphomicrobiales bacterium]|nr:Sec-independent protein translocase protein TatB [Hyphomicrobiales bacterium]
MFDIAWSELLLVAVVAILVVGPKELPGMLRSLGRMLGKLRRTADEFRKHFDDAIRDVGAEDLQREMNSLKQNNPLSQIRSSIEDAAKDVSGGSTAKTETAETEKRDNDAYDDLGPPPPPLPPKDAPASADASANAAPPTQDRSSVPATNPDSDDDRGAPRVNGAHGTAGQGL